MVLEVSENADGAVARDRVQQLALELRSMLRIQNHASDGGVEVTCLKHRDPSNTLCQVKCSRA